MYAQTASLAVVAVQVSLTLTVVPVVRHVVIDGRLDAIAHLAEDGGPISLGILLAPTEGVDIPLCVIHADILVLFDTDGVAVRVTPDRTLAPISVAQAHVGESVVFEQPAGQVVLHPTRCDDDLHVRVLLHLVLYSYSSALIPGMKQSPAR